MIIIKETCKTEAYTPLAKFEDRVIAFNTFFEGLKANFKRELELFFNDGRKESLIVIADPSFVKVNTTAVTIENRNTGLLTILNFKILNIGAISEVSNNASTDYIFPLAKYRGMFYRIRVC